MDTSLANKGAVSKSRRARPAAPIYVPPALRREQQNSSTETTQVAQTNVKNSQKTNVIQPDATSNQSNVLILERLKIEDNILKEKSENDENQIRKPKILRCSNCSIDHKEYVNNKQKLPYTYDCKLCKNDLKKTPTPVISDNENNNYAQSNDKQLEISTLPTTGNHSHESINYTNGFPQKTYENNSILMNEPHRDVSVENISNVDVPNSKPEMSETEGKTTFAKALANLVTENCAEIINIAAQLPQDISQTKPEEDEIIKILTTKSEYCPTSNITEDLTKLVSENCSMLTNISNVYNKQNTTRCKTKNFSEIFTQMSQELDEGLASITKSEQTMKIAVEKCLEQTKLSDLSIAARSRSNFSCPNDFQIDERTIEMKSNIRDESVQTEVKELETKCQTQVGEPDVHEPTTNTVNSNVCIIEPSEKSDHNCDTDQAEMVRASEEINRSNKRIMKHLLNKSDMLIITDQRTQIDTNGTGAHNETDAGAAVDNWEDLLSEEKTVDNIVYKSKSNHAKKTYHMKESNREQNNETLDGDLSHVVEIYDFPEEFQTRDLLAIFDSMKMTNYNIKWVDDTHALGVFNSGFAANEVLKMNHPLIKVRPITEASKQSKSKVKRYPNAMVPNAVRPQTCPQTARRMVTGALGLKLINAKEERAKEIKILKEAREKKKLKAKLEDEAWEGKMISK